MLNEKGIASAPRFQQFFFFLPFGFYDWNFVCVSYLSCLCCMLCPCYSLDEARKSWNTWGRNFSHLPLIAKYSPTWLWWHWFMWHFFASIRYCVEPINSPSLTIALYSSVRAALVNTDKIFTPFHDFVTEFDCIFSAVFPEMLNHVLSFGWETMFHTHVAK